MINYALLKAIADFGSLLLSGIALLVSLFIYFSNRGRATRKETDERISAVEDEIKDEFKVVDQRLNSLDIRVNQASERIEHLPGHDEMNRVHDRVSEVKNSVSQISQNVAGISASMDGIKMGIGTLQTTVQQLVDNELAEARAAKEGNSKR